MEIAPYDITGGRVHLDVCWIDQSTSLPSGLWQTLQIQGQLAGRRPSPLRVLGLKFHSRAAAAQVVEQVLWRLEGCWFEPLLLQAQ